MAGVSAYAAEAQTTGTGGSTRRLQGFVRAKGKFDLHLHN
jgi:hypothetical protein